MNEREVEELLRSFRAAPAPAPRVGRWGWVSVAAAAAALVAVVALVVVAVPRGGGMSAARQDEEEVLRLIGRLGSDDFAEREAAAAELRRRGAGLVPVLKRELERAKDAEIASRLKGLIAELGRPSFELVKELDLSGDGHAAAAVWTPDGRGLVVAGGSGSDGVRVYDTRTWAARRIELPEEAHGATLGLAVSPEGSAAALLHAAGTTVFRLSDGATVRTFPCENGHTAAVFTSEDGILLASAGANRPASLDAFALAGPRLVSRDMPQGTAPVHLAYAPARRQVGYVTSQIEVFDAATMMTRVLLGRPQAKDGAKGSGCRVAFSPDEERMAVEGQGGMVQVFRTKDWSWDGASWRPHDVKSPPAFAFTPDGRHLISAAADGRVVAWGVGGDWTKEAASVACERERVFLAVSRADGRIVVGRDGGAAVVRVYRLREP